MFHSVLKQFWNVNWKNLSALEHFLHQTFHENIFLKLFKYFQILKEKRDYFPSIGDGLMQTVSSSRFFKQKSNVSITVGGDWPASLVTGTGWHTADANSHSDRGVVDTKQTVCW